MARPRKQTYTLKMYLDKIIDGDISNDGDVQRDFVWSNEQVNNLIVTVLTDDYIPPIILGEELNSQLHIADGGQRSAALMKFRYTNYKITSAIEDSIIPYRKKIKNEDGTIGWEESEFDIKNKTFDKLPEELQKKFDEYQIDTVIHENCDSKRISKYIKIYNCHTGMNTNQKAFTYIGNFARDIRRITDMKFFIDNSNFKEKEKNKGVLERVVVETIMCMNYMDNWKKQTKAICTFLNNNGSETDFEKLESNLHRLENIITDDVNDIFNSKDSFLFLTLFDKFNRTGIDDIEFVNFIRAFKSEYRDSRVNENGELFDQIDENKSTKDKTVIVAKLDMLTKLMYEYLGIEEQVAENVTVEEFISDVTDIELEEVSDNMDFYEDILDDIADKTIRVGTELSKAVNRISLLALVAYSLKNELDCELEVWLEEFAKNNNTYFADQKKNYVYMLNAFENRPVVKQARG